MIIEYMLLLHKPDGFTSSRTMSLSASCLCVM